MIVDDSAVLRQQLRFILQSDSELLVVGEARDGEEAVALAKKLRPDVITMDIRMPRMDGLDAIRHIMAESPVPIVVVTADDVDKELGVTQRAPQLGAVAVLHKPGGISDPIYKAMSAKLIEQVKLMSGVKVISRPRSVEAKLPIGTARAQAQPSTAPFRSCEAEIIAMGASTGGPAALYKVLGGLPAKLPVPIVLVQHISLGFVEGLASWLAGGCKLPVRVGKHGEKLEGGTVYVAPDGCHMAVDVYGRLRLWDTPPVGGHRPAVNVLFESVAEAYGARAIGVLLTGMGADGAKGLKAMYDAGAMTIAQDEQSCVVFGMPREAIALGAARQIVPLDHIADMISRLCRVDHSD